MNEQSQPGQWPVADPVNLVTDEHDAHEQHLLFTAERARFALTLGSIRADLEEQPSERCVRDAARRWQNAITALADETAQQLKKTG